MTDRARQNPSDELIHQRVPRSSGWPWPSRSDPCFFASPFRPLQIWSLKVIIITIIFIIKKAQTINLSFQILTWPFRTPFSTNTNSLKFIISNNQFGKLKQACPVSCSCFTCFDCVTIHISVPCRVSFEMFPCNDMFSV